jgi:hypothetical protein
VNPRSLTLQILPEHLAIVRLAPDAAIPAWATLGSFFVVARTTDELSLICASDLVPTEIDASRGWRAIKLVGPFDLSEVGILVAIATPLAEAGVCIMPVATYDTDYVLVQNTQLAAAITRLTAAGHRLRTS